MGKSNNKDFLLSIVVPVYKEENNIRPFLERTVKVMKENYYRYEIIFCLDPSPDNTFQVICDCIKENDNIRLIQFSRRFGQPAATMAGIYECKGDACIVTDVDLQDPPELMKEMVDCWIKEGVNSVYGQRKSREGEHLIKKAVSYLGYYVINRFGEVEIPVNTGDFRLIDRKIIDEIKKSEEHHGFFRGMVAYIGYKQEAIKFDRDARYSGKGNYNPFVGSLHIGLNGLICYSVKPLEFMTVFGTLAAIVGILAVIYCIFEFMLSLFSISIPLLPVNTALILFFGGVGLLFIGLLGEYIGRTYEEVRHRPRYIIDKVVDSESLERAYE